MKNELIVVQSGTVTYKENVDKHIVAIKKDIAKLNLDKLDLTNEAQKGQIKEIRANFNITIKEIKTRLKSAKELILKPYLQAEEYININLLSFLNSQEEILGNAVKQIEDGQKKVLEDELKEYFVENTRDIEEWFWDFKDLNLKVNLTSKIYQLKIEIGDFIDEKIKEIENLKELGDDYFIEYKLNGHNYALALSTIAKRDNLREKAAIENMLKAAEIEQEEPREEFSIRLKPLRKLTAETFFNTQIEKVLRIKCNEEKINLLYSFMKLNDIEFVEE